MDFFINDFIKIYDSFLHDDINFCVTKIPVLNHSESFHKYHVKISIPYCKQFLRKNKLHKHYFNIGKIGYVRSSIISFTYQLHKFMNSTSYVPESGY